MAGLFSLVLAGIAGGAAAQDYAAKSSGAVSPWYIGAGFGQSFASIPDQTVDGIDSALTAANGASFSTVDKDKNSASSKFFAGYTFSPYFAAELGYVALGNSK